ncbi:MAG: hypothetical protein DRG87_12920 [Deltaproteobacteria bacterium]|nr:sugar transferase [Deltaproteobacteria bacterium]RLB26446.1 MAG: hypothetical protein DRG87_12920 [Deltaproteobacteria bacterium]
MDPIYLSRSSDIAFPSFRTDFRPKFTRSYCGGQKSEKFKEITFAAMLKDSPNIRTGTATVKNDPRILPFGRILRRAKINELPQLINVI